jgi:hypothetical protein
VQSDIESFKSIDDRGQWMLQPTYYEHESGLNCVDIAKRLAFLRGNIVKYVWRAGNKGDLVQDLQKAIEYAQILIVDPDRVCQDQELVSMIDWYCKNESHDLRRTIIRSAALDSSEIDLKEGVLMKLDQWVDSTRS